MNLTSLTQAHLNVLSSLLAVIYPGLNMLRSRINPEMKWKLTGGEYSHVFISCQRFSHFVLRHKTRR